MKTESSSPKHGLPNCLHIPIAATDIDTIAIYVGTIDEKIRNSSGDIRAIRVSCFNQGIPAHHTAPLWKSDQRSRYAEALFPKYQVWVHVNYSNYRSAYCRLGMPAIPEGYCLDHIQNRKAIRLRWHSHPFLRLAPISAAVNTSGGHKTGGEGLETEFLMSLRDKPRELEKIRKLVHSYKLQYADPMDLTKMLDISPGTQVLNGVRDCLKLFYPN